MCRKISLLLLSLIIILCITVTAYADGIRLPSGLMRIDEEAFENTNLDSVMIPNGTTRIEAKAFANSSVRIVRFPRSVSFIADDAFLNCPNVTLEVQKDSYAYEWAKNLIKEYENPINDIKFRRKENIKRIISITLIPLFISSMITLIIFIKKKKSV